jgi:hypothetical protein
MGIAFTRIELRNEPLLTSDLRVENIANVGLNRIVGAKPQVCSAETSDLAAWGRPLKNEVSVGRQTDSKA